MVALLAAARQHLAQQHVGGAGEIGDEGIGRPVIDLGRRRHLQQLALAHHADAVAQHHGLGLVVGDVEAGHAGLLQDAAQLVAQADAQLGVEVAERLVEQDELRPVDQASRQRHALHLAARQRRHRPLGIVAEADQLERVVDLGLDVAAPPLPLRRCFSG